MQRASTAFRWTSRPIVSTRPFPLVRHFPVSSLLLLAAIAILLAACRQPPGPEFRFILVSQELAVEQSRFTFAILDRANQPVEDARVSVEFLAPGGDEATTQAIADFRQIDLSAPPSADPEWYNPDVDVRGIYAIDNAPFDSPGEWELRVSVKRSGMESPEELRVGVEVLAESSTPGLAEKVPPIDHLTSTDVTDISQISTAPNPVASMYRTSVSEALGDGRPFLVVFATPAFCQSRTCGPVLETVIKLLPDYQNDLVFIHVEPYDLGLIRDENKLEPSKEARAWGLPSEPWVFMVDSSGRLTAKFEGIVTLEELARAVKKTLAPGRGS